MRYAAAVSGALSPRPLETTPWQYASRINKPRFRSPKQGPTFANRPGWTSERAGDRNNSNTLLDSRDHHHVRSILVRQFANFLVPARDRQDLMALVGEISHGLAPDEDVLAQVGLFYEAVGQSIFIIRPSRRPDHRFSTSTTKSQSLWKGAEQDHYPASRCRICFRRTRRK